MAAVCLVGMLGAPGAAKGQAVDQYALKSAFLFRFTSFVQWPTDGPSDGTPFVIAVYGEDPFGEALNGLDGRTVGNRTVEVRRDLARDDLADVDILFVADPESVEARRVLDAVENFPVLTVGDGEDFAQQGIIGFVIRDRRVRFQINRCAAEKAGLRISSQLLQIADRVLARCDEGDR